MTERSIDSVEFEIDGVTIVHHFDQPVSVDEARDFVFAQMDAAAIKNDSHPGADGVG